MIQNDGGKREAWRERAERAEAPSLLRTTLHLVLLANVDHHLIGVIR